MQITPDMIKALNEQISHEAYSANAYLAIGSWCERIGYDGSAAFFLEQAAEEKVHMLKFIHYLNNAGYEAIVPGIEKPPGSFESLEAAFKFVMKNPSSIAVGGGILVFLLGVLLQDAWIMFWGVVFFFVGVGLNLAYLSTKKR